MKSLCGRNPATLVLAASLGGSFFAHAAPGRWTVEWKSQPDTEHPWKVEVAGLSPAELQTLSGPARAEAEWQRVLAVYAETGDLVSAVTVPAMLGDYQVGKDRLLFEPRFPLQPGIRYRAVFRPAELPGAKQTGEPAVSKSHELPSQPVQSTTVVTHVYPSAAVLPANLLKFYLHFSAPMSRGGIYEHIRLLNAAGQSVELPFLEIDEELWSPDMTRLTLFIDPGRIKHGVKPLEDLGPALVEGRDYTLVIDRSWPDAKGHPLKETLQHGFSVGPADVEAPDPARWKVHAPKSGSRDPLVVEFGESLDQALALRMLQVNTSAGVRVSGEVALSDHERRWSFTPQQAWANGTHQLRVLTTIEDLAGNNIGKPFEVDLFESVQRSLTNSVVQVGFDVR